MIISGDVGPPGSLCGILGVHVDDPINGGRGVRWEKAMNRFRVIFPFRKWMSGSGEFTGSWSEPRSDFSTVQSQKTFATGV